MVTDNPAEDMDAGCKLNVMPGNTHVLRWSAGEDCD